MVHILFKYSKKCQKTEFYIIMYYALFKFQGHVEHGRRISLYGILTSLFKVKRSRLELKPRPNPYYNVGHKGILRSYSGTHVNIILYTDIIWCTYFKN